MITHDVRGSSTPEFRTAIISAVLSKVCAATEPIKALAVIQMVLDELAVTEEVASQEISSAMFLLITTGLIESTGYERHGDEESHSVGVNTTLKPCGQLTRYLWDEQTSIIKVD
jgi:hypothetical protein